MPDEHDMQTAVARRDAGWDDRFVYGVVTTGVFCRPSCPSRAARPENLRFFLSADAAEESGYRPCKRCQPESGSLRRTELVSLARLIEQRAGETLSLESLATIAGLSPSRLQKRFKATFGVSPKAYQDAARLKQLKKSLKEGDRVTDAILQSGYGSISRVYGESKRSMGMTPTAYRGGAEGEQITYACRETSLGMIAMAATAKGVCFVEFGEDADSLKARLEAEFPRATLDQSAAAEAPELDEWIEAINRYVSEGAPSPDLPLDIRGTAFQIKVWQYLKSIPEGEVRSYSEVAAELGKSSAVRAVASACARNRIGLLIPCHRVLRADGQLGGYRWGLDRKKALLRAERAHRPVSSSIPPATD